MTDSPLANEALTAPLPKLFLEIARGVTNFPRRPISIERFAIGSGEDCDLQLGGGDIPTIHSTIHFDGQQTRLDAIAASPAVLVNGRVERSVALKDGDHIQIGDFDFIVGRLDDAHPLALVPESILDEEAEELDLSELSAEELVDLIEAEQEQVDEFDGGREAGAAALLSVVRDLAEGPVPLADDESEDDVLEDIEHILSRLNSYADDLHVRSRHLNDREGSYAEAAEMLMNFQKQISAQLESLTGQVSRIQSRLEEVEGRERRAIA